ncbi:M48 family metallopeptidase [Cesiribacter sp. SM1]|uniref:M48 family metallopeptidase n=1 Tax=Cesiribacter sp. SM1 TaxID=2861196 RepID=UPI001CD39981|nr:M48 family metallopeptidase [Cesiribacter sp. SM1]
MKNFLPILFLSLLILCGCDRNSNVNLFSPDQDVQLGAQINEEILSKHNEYPVLNPSQYPESYEYLNGIVNNILESGQVNYRDEFAWQVYIINDDNTLNAFATPGGYIYVYTGLIKYLDREDDLAGVLGHEIAHADLRHSTRQLQKMYGLNLLLSLAVGEGSGLEQIMGQVVGNLTALSFSREYEREADSRSVDYLSGTDYECDAAKSFFIKLSEMEEQGQVPTFLSTHPNPDRRIQSIEARSQEVGCSTEPLDPQSYQAFKQSLP